MKSDSPTESECVSPEVNPILSSLPVIGYITNVAPPRNLILQSIHLSLRMLYQSTLLPPLILGIPLL